MHANEWIGLGIIALVIIGGLLLLNQITKPYDVKTEEEFEKHWLYIRPETMHAGAVEAVSAYRKLSQD